MIVTAGALVGSAYWFRFHFLSFALLFPFFTILFKKENGPGLKMFIRAAAGVLISVLVPHLLCLYSYGIFSISNEKFILAQALGIADWSYEFSCKLETLTTADMFKEFDWKLFVLKYCYHFVKSGIFLFLIIYGIALWGYLKERIINGESINRTNRYYQLIMIASYGLISVVPFTVIRGFTYRLEAAFIVFQIPLIVWTITNLPKNYKRAITITLLTAVCYHLTVYGKSLSAYEDYVVHNQKLISENIPASILKERPQDVVCCVDYYNPYNKYKICNPMVYAGWGVRFKPLIENFGFLNLRNPYGNPIYKNAKYIVLPSNTYEFNYDKNILKSGNVVFKDDDILIISRETKDKNL